MQVTGLGRGVAAAAGFGVLWVGLAMLRPDATFHLGPVIMAGAPAIVTVRRRGTAAVLGLALAATSAFGMAAAGLLAGPSLLPWGGALAESVVGATAGAGVALVAGSLLPRADRGSTTVNPGKPTTEAGHGQNPAL